MDKNFYKPEDILNESQLDRFKTSTKCVCDGCENTVDPWQQLTCKRHKKELPKDSDLNRLQKCCVDKCYNLIENQHGKWSACDECKNENSSNEYVTMNITEEEAKQLQKEGVRFSDEKPICYNHIKVTQLIETLKQLAQINEVDINNFTILKTSYNPDDGSMLFDIKLN